MASFDAKAVEPTQLVPDSALLFGANSQDAPTPAVYPLQSVLGGVVNVLHKGAVADWDGDSGTDCYQAFVDAIATGKAVFVPDGSYYISQPIEAEAFMAIVGAAEIQLRGTRGARIYAPAGFLVNSDEARDWISIENLEVYGAGAEVTGVKAIDGRLGGLFRGCYFHDFDTIMENDAAYALTIDRCKFHAANTGLRLSSPHGSVVRNCLFNAGVTRQIDTYNLTPAPDGSRDGTPFIVVENIFNLGPGSCSVFSGRLIFRDNFSEPFEESTAIPFEYVAMRFAEMTFNISDNHMSGQNLLSRCWHFYSDHSSGTMVRGVFERNTIVAYSDAPILIGTKEDFYDRVDGIRFADNNATQAQYVEYNSTNYNVSPHKLARLSYSGTLDISGSSYTAIPLTPASGFIQDVSDGSIRISESGTYRISAEIQLSYSGAARLCEFVFTNLPAPDDAPRFQTLPDAVAGGDNYCLVRVEALSYLTNGTLIAIRGRNGGNVTRALVTIYKLPDARHYAGY